MVSRLWLAVSAADSIMSPSALCTASRNPVKGDCEPHYGTFGDGRYKSVFHRRMRPLFGAASAG